MTEETKKPQRRPKVRREVMPTPPERPQAEPEVRKRTARSDATIGRDADQVLNSPAFKMVMQNVKAAIEDGWKNSAPADVDARENAYKLQVLHDSYLRNFLKLSQAGADARILLEDLMRKEQTNHDGRT